MSGYKDVFISYGRRESKVFANRLYQFLLKHGYDVWFDQNDIPLGVDFQDQIDDGIERTHNFIFIISPHAVQSAYCLKEILLAVKRGKRIIPVLHVEPVGVWQQMHPAIAKRNWIYMRERFEAGLPLEELHAIDDFEKGAEGLVKLLETHKEYVQMHTELLYKALVWQRQARISEHLLVGHERQQAEKWLLREFQAPQMPPCEPSHLHTQFITESKKNGENLQTDFFISYAQEDHQDRDRVVEALNRKALTCWIHHHDIAKGEKFGQAIERGIELADQVLFFISPHSLRSEWCLKELAYAQSFQKRIIPLLIAETPVEDYPESIRGLQYVDFTNNQDEETELDDSFFQDRLNNPKELESGAHGVYFKDNSRTNRSLNEKSNFEQDIDQIIAMARQEADYFRQHKVFLVQALRWQRQHNASSLLLRGYNLDKARTWLDANRRRDQHPPTQLHQDFISESIAKIGQLDTEVFISYSRKDADLARKLNQALQDNGKTTWFDQESIAEGEDFQREIEKGILQSDNFLFIISPDAIASNFCEQEVRYAASLGKRFVSLLHRPVDPDTLPKELAAVQWIKFNELGFEKGFSKLLETLNIDRAHVNAHTRYSRAAQEWKERQFNNDLLLRGQALDQAESWLQTAIAESKNPAPNAIQQDLIKRSRQVFDDEQQQRMKEQFEKVTLLSRQQQAEMLQKNSARVRFLLPMFLAIFISMIIFIAVMIEGEGTYNTVLDVGFGSFMVFYMGATAIVLGRLVYTRFTQINDQFYQDLLQRAAEYKAGRDEARMTSSEVRHTKNWVKRHVERRQAYKLAEVQRELLEASEQNPAKKRYIGTGRNSPEYIRLQQKRLKNRFFLYTVLFAIAFPFFLMVEGYEWVMFGVHSILSLIVYTIVGSRYWKMAQKYQYYMAQQEISRRAMLWEITGRDPNLLLNEKILPQAEAWLNEPSEALQPDELECNFIKASL